MDVKKELKEVVALLRNAASILVDVGCGDLPKGQFSAVFDCQYSVDKSLEELETTIKHWDELFYN